MISSELEFCGLSINYAVLSLLLNSEVMFNDII